MPTASQLIQTDRSAVLRSYPWSNGLGLHENRHAFLEATLKDTKHPLPLVDLTLSLAKQIDHSVAVLFVADLSTRAFLTKFLGVKEEGLSVDDARKSLVNLGRSGDSVSNTNLIAAANVMFRYRLLDIVGDILEVPRHENVTFVPRCPQPHHKSDRLDRALSALKDWPKVIVNFQNMYHTSHQKPRRMENPAVFSEESGAQAQFQCGIQSLTRVHCHLEGQQLNKVMYNLEVLVFCVWWFAIGFADFPSDEHALVELFTQRAKDLGIPDGSYEVLGKISGDLKSLANVMRNVFYLATSISPLVVLCPRRLDNESIRRDYLISTAVAFGNQKPKLLQEAEKSLWSTIARLAAGLDEEKELSTLLDSFGAMDVLQEGIEADWFVQTIEPVKEQEPSEMLAVTGPSQQSSQAASVNDSTRALPIPRQGLHLPPDDSAERKSKPSQDRKTMPNLVSKKRDEKKKGSRKKKSGSRNSKRVGGLKIRRRQVQDNKPTVYRGFSVSLPLPTPDPPRIKQKQKGAPPLVPITDDPPEFVKDGLQLKLFGIKKNAPPMKYEYKGSVQTWELEHAPLALLTKAIQGRCRNGQPLHHFDNARSMSYIPGASRSEFFVTTTEEFMKLNGHQVQEIFRHRHILLSGSPPENFQFDSEGLATLGSLDTVRDIQVHSLRNLEKGDAMLRRGTLEDLLAKDKSGNHRVLNALDLPMGGAPLEFPPQYQNLASNEHAWLIARDLLGPSQSTLFPSDATVWGTAATRDATTWQHIDDHGMATIVKVMAGRKYWVTLRPKYSRGKGDMTSINAIEDDYPEAEWDYEGVLLNPGDILYMKPNTVHYALTVEDAIMYGRHLYPSASMQATVCGIVHTFVLNYAATNVLHDNLGTMLRRMMAMWTEHYFRLGPVYCNNPHIPNLSTMSGLLDIVALGNLMESAQVLDRRSYGKPGIPWLELNEMALARHRYRSFQNWFIENHTVALDGKTIFPDNIFRRLFVDFAAFVVRYKQKTPRSQNRPAGCTAYEVEKRMLSLFESNFPELLPCLRSTIKDEATTSCLWRGPIFTIQVNNGQRRDPKLRQLQDRPLYPPIEPGANAEGRDDDEVIVLHDPEPLPIKSRPGTPDARPVKRRRSGETSGDSTMTELRRDGELAGDAQSGDPNMIEVDIEMEGSGQGEDGGEAGGDGKGDVEMGVLEQAEEEKAAYDEIGGKSLEIGVEMKGLDEIVEETRSGDAAQQSKEGSEAQAKEGDAQQGARAKGDEAMLHLQAPRRGTRREKSQPNAGTSSSRASAALGLLPDVDKGKTSSRAISPLCKPEVICSATSVDALISRFLELETEEAWCLPRLEACRGAFTEQISKAALARSELAAPRPCAQRRSNRLRLPELQVLPLLPTAPVVPQDTMHFKKPEQNCPPKKNKRSGKASDRKRDARRKREGSGSAMRQQREKLAEKLLRRSDVLSNQKFCIVKDGAASTTGWQGIPLPTGELARLIARYKSGDIFKDLQNFHRLPYTRMPNPVEEKAAFVLDRFHKTLFTRSPIAQWMLDPSQQIALTELIHDLVGSDLSLDSKRWKCAKGPRGPHLDCIVGYHRQYQRAPALTAWHAENREKVQRFVSHPLIQRIIGAASAIVKYSFPGIKERFDRAAEWHKARHNIEPEFGLFWNLCINAAFPISGEREVPSIRCLPHVDSRNGISVCVLFIYLLTGNKFDDSKKTWLVIWELGVIIQLPPWVFAAYPSSLLIHFNIDVDDIRLIYTNGDLPTRENSTDLTKVNDKGRGSFVFFNQASMFHGPETGFDMLGTAKEHGCCAISDYPKVAQQAFTDKARFFPIFKEVEEDEDFLDAE